MLPNEKSSFVTLMVATLGVYDKIPDPATTGIWWNALVAHGFDEVKTAFAEHIKRGKFAPRPADILELLDALTPDGRLGADEAWAMCPRDESVSVVITDEIMSAWGVAQHLLNEGDQVAARMAFKEAYTRIVEANRRNNVKPIWRASLGWDHGGRVAVLAEAVRFGRLQVEYAIGLLPPDKIDMMLSMAGVETLAITCTPNDSAVAFLAEINAVLKRKENFAHFGSDCK